MTSRAFSATTCILCCKAVDLRTDLNADENGKSVHEDCYVNRLSGVRSNKTSAEQLLDMLSAQSTARRCLKCGLLLLHADVTFLSQSGKSWVIRLPICVKCSTNDVAPLTMDA
ncbi:MAG: hypothetical protein WB762_12195 [Candidatus Sulfotelmatobacter sp.]